LFGEKAFWSLACRLEKNPLFLVWGRRKRDFLAQQTQSSKTNSQ